MKCWSLCSVQRFIFSSGFSDDFSIIFSDPERLHHSADWFKAAEKQQKAVCIKHGHTELNFLQEGRIKVSLTSTTTVEEFWLFMKMSFNVLTSLTTGKTWQCWTAGFSAELQTGLCWSDGFHTQLWCLSVHVDHKSVICMFLQLDKETLIMSHRRLDCLIDRWRRY